jgi:hypothetical protein
MTMTELKTGVDVRTKEVGGQAIFTILFSRAAAKEWGLAIGRGRGKANLSFEVRQAEPQPNMRYYVEFAAPAMPRAEVFVDGSRTVFRLNRNQFDQIYSFLKPYCDTGMSSVDHIDLQGHFHSQPQRDVYIILKVPNSAVPLTPEQAEKWLPG